MKLATCPTHGGRTCLTNAGVPNLVRCAITGTCFEPCRRCRGTAWMALFSLLPGGDDEAAPCLGCRETPGWRTYPGKAGGIYPVS